jgi:hypothetical protein
MSLTDGEDMTISTMEPLPPHDPRFDGRQSAAAFDIARGTRRLLLTHGMASLPEVTLASGRRADLVGLSERGEVWIIEIKSSVEDFRADQKWPEYRAFCDRLFFAVNSEFPQALLPVDTGLIVADRFGAAVVRESPLHALAPARRKALTLRLARLGAMRLLALADPELRLEQVWNE